jgi:hypothetical protein
LIDIWIDRQFKRRGRSEVNVVLLAFQYSIRRTEIPLLPDDIPPMFDVNSSFSSATIKIPHGVEGFPVRAGSERSPVLPVGQHA